jgi:hypothetical protein
VTLGDFIRGNGRRDTRITLSLREESADVVLSLGLFVVREITSRPPAEPEAHASAQD